MSLLKYIQPTPEQIQAVAEYEIYCRALRDATIERPRQTAPDRTWKLWFAAAERVRESGLDPLDYSNARRGIPKSGAGQGGDDI
jgi:hypothetical protein